MHNKIIKFRKQENIINSECCDGEVTLAISEQLLPGQPFVSWGKKQPMLLRTVCSRENEFTRQSNYECS